MSHLSAKPPSTRPQRCPSLATACLTVLLLSACHRIGNDATQVAAKVNDGEISLAQVQQTLQRQPGVPADRADAQARHVLDGLIQQELAAQAARRDGLDRDPRVIQAMEAAKREVHARAYHDTLADKASLPSSDDVDRYFDSQPALFSQRRLYALQEVAVEGSAEQLLAVSSSIDSAAEPGQVPNILHAAHLNHRVRHVTVSPEDVPLVLLDRLSKLRDGQTLVVPQPGGARVLTVLSSTPAPLSREAARPLIQSFLVNERKREAIQQGMKALQAAARIDYQGRFAAQAASAPASDAR